MAVRNVLVMDLKCNFDVFQGDRWETGHVFVCFQT